MYKKTCKHLNYVEHLLILASTIAGCISVSAFASLVCVPIGISSFVLGLSIFAIIAGIKKYKSITKKKKEKKKHGKIVLLGKNKLNTIEVLISKSLINFEFVSLNNVSREYNEMKK